MCERTAELYPKNYYAWTHRQWIISKITDTTQLRKGECSSLPYALVLYVRCTQRFYSSSCCHVLACDSELERCSTWNSNNVSDYCGFHYRQYVLLLIMKQHAFHQSLASSALILTQPLPSPTSIAAVSDAPHCPLHCQLLSRWLYSLP